MFFTKRQEAVNTTATAPAPKVVDTTGEFGGNDGPWSTFYVNVGDQQNDGGGQTFKVLPSTWFGVTLLPYTADWCDLDCAQDRGVGPVDGQQERGLVTTDTSTWNQAGNYELSLPEWWQNQTDESPGGLYGLDYLGIGAASEKSYVVPNMFVAATISKDFYTGQFGLGPGSTNVGYGKGDVNSILATFKNSDYIHSASYGYTAGAIYRNSGNGILGSLVLGGYDENRVNADKSVSMLMPNEKNTTLVVGVQQIQYTPDSAVDPNSLTLSKDVRGFRATIDSTTPYLWLPDQVCDQFIDKFQLSYDNETDLYMMNSSSAAHNRQQNAVVSFRIGQDPFGSDDQFASIDLPFSAFDLDYKPPEGGNGTKYFPIKKSNNGRFVLGRAFLQEAYIIVDYGRANFTVASTVVSDSDGPPASKIVPIYDEGNSPSLVPTGGGSKGLSGGAIAGIVVGILIVALGAAFGIFMWWKKRRERKKAPPPYKSSVEIDTAAAGSEVKHRRISELDSVHHGSPKPGAFNGFYGNRGDGKDNSPFPTISEMDSPPAELDSPPVVPTTPHREGNGSDYFTAGQKLGRRGARRESANNTPGTPPFVTPVAELPGDDGHYQVGGQHFTPMPSPKASPTLTAASHHIDEVMKRHSAEPSPSRSSKDSQGRPSQDTSPKPVAEEEPLERRPSHARGLSDTTVQSDTTVVSQPTPEELERWALAEDEQPRRPLSE